MGSKRCQINDRCAMQLKSGTKQKSHEASAERSLCVCVCV